MARNVINPLTQSRLGGKSLGQKSVEQLLKSMTEAKAQVGKNKIESEKNRLSKIKEQNRATEEANKIIAANEKDFMTNIYKPLLVKVNGNLSDQRVAREMLAKGDDGISFYEKHFDLNVPEQNRGNYKSYGDITQLIGANETLKQSVVSDLQYFRNTNNPESDRMTVFKRAEKRRLNGEITQPEFEKYFVIAKNNQMAALGYNKEVIPNSENPMTRASLSSNYGDIARLGLKFEDDYKTNAENYKDFNVETNLKYREGYLAILGGQEAENPDDAKNFRKAFQENRTSKAQAYLVDAAISGRAREIMSSDLGNLEMEKQHTLGILGGLAIEAIPELAKFDTPKALSDALSATDLNGDLTKEAIRLSGLLTDKLEEALGPREDWEQYLGTEYSKFRLIK